MGLGLRSRPICSKILAGERENELFRPVAMAEGTSGWETGPKTLVAIGDAEVSQRLWRSVYIES